MSQWGVEQFPSNNMFPLPPPPMLPSMIAGAVEDINGQPFDGSLPGPQMMPNMNTEIQDVNMEINDDNNATSSRLNRGPNRSGARGANDRPRRRSRDRDRSRHEVDRTRSDRRDRSRPSKWSNADDNTGLQTEHMGSQARPMTAMMVQGMTPNVPGHVGGQMMMSGAANMMQYPGQMYSNNMMGQQQLDMQNMNIQPSMMGMPNMMSNMMMDPAMMNQIYTQQMNPMMGGIMPISNQAIYLSSAVLLPPIPGTSMPERKEKPPGCCTIFVGGLPDNIREDLIREMFQRFGKIIELKLNRRGFCHIRYAMMESVEAAFSLTGYRFKYQDQLDNEAITLFIDYTAHRDDQADFERSKRAREPTPPRVEPFTPSNLTAISDKIKSEELFSEAAPTLSGWLERGECNKRNANTFYSLIQATNNQIRRLFNEKMQVEEEFSTLKTTMRDKFQHILTQFELVAKILSASKHQRVWDHFSKQQRRNIETWMKITQELDNLKEEFNVYFDEDDEKPSKKSSWEEKYEEIKRENENLNYELAGYKNEAHVAKEEAERKFEKFKAHFIAQQALQNNKPMYQPPLPKQVQQKPAPPPPLPDDEKIPLSGPTVAPTEARLISVITAFLLVHPLGASLDYIVSYVRSIMPKVTQATVHDILQKQDDVFARKTTGVGASIENRWTFITFDNLKIKQE